MPRPGFYKKKTKKNENLAVITAEKKQINHQFDCIKKLAVPLQAA